MEIVWLQIRMKRIRWKEDKIANKANMPGTNNHIRGCN
ncbi:MAG: hypothetical protein JWP12_671 [Bacteroidetes bacterium]|nr:hypothetical protein [Bacteroidota bacterium]